MPKTDAAKLPIITFKPFISEKGFELLANAVVEQAVHDYKRLLHRIYSISVLLDLLLTN